MVISSGILIIKNNEILLCHPTNAPWFNSYSIPKGKVDENDKDLIDTAIRETYEEVGIIVNRNKIKKPDNNIIFYRNKKGKIYKKLYYYLLFVDYNPTIKLQKNEVDWAGFLNKENAEKRIFWRFREMLNYI
jgi:ADP-ribose pyrophosphatase YjhB (NUDIX family)